MQAIKAKLQIKSTGTTQEVYLVPSNESEYFRTGTNHWLGLKNKQGKIWITLEPTAEDQRALSSLLPPQPGVKKMRLTTNWYPSTDQENHLEMKTSIQAIDDRARLYEFFFEESLTTFRMVYNNEIRPKKYNGGWRLGELKHYADENGSEAVIINLDETEWTQNEDPSYIADHTYIP